MNGYQSKRRFDETALYCFARCEQFLEDYARSNQISAYELTFRVAELFQLQTNRPLLGTENSLSSLQRNGTGLRGTLAEVEMASGPRGSAQVKRPVGRPRKTHWTQLPNNRKKMMTVISQMRETHKTTRKPRKKMTAQEAHERKIQRQREWRAKQKQEQQTEQQA